MCFVKHSYYIYSFCGKAPILYLLTPTKNGGYTHSTIAEEGFATAGENALKEGTMLLLSCLGL